MEVWRIFESSDLLLTWSLATICQVWYYSSGANGIGFGLLAEGSTMLRKIGFHFYASIPAGVRIHLKITSLTSEDALWKSCTHVVIQSWMSAMALDSSCKDVLGMVNHIALVREQVLNKWSILCCFLACETRWCQKDTFGMKLCSKR